MLNLRRILLVAASTSLLSIGVATANTHSAARGKMLIGLQLYTVRDDCAKDFPGALKAVSDIGYSGVEFAGYFGRTAEQLKQMLDEDHLKCYGTHLSLDSLTGDEFAKTVAFNKVIGNHLLVIPSLSSERRNSRVAILETCKIFNDIAKKLEPYGMMLAYHDHAPDFQLVDGEPFWLTLFNNTDKRVKIQFDTGNALEAGVQAAPLIAKYPGRVVSVHLKDFSPTKPQVLLGEGEEDWNSVLPLLKGPAGTRWFIIEQETYPFPPLVCAQKCLDNFKRMLKSVR